MLKPGSIYRTADGSLVRIISADSTGIVFRYADGTTVAVSA